MVFFFSETIAKPSSIRSNKVLLLLPEIVERILSIHNTFFRVYNKMKKNEKNEKDEEENKYNSETRKAIINKIS